MDYLKMKLQFVCKMAMLLAVVFTACSDDVAGGVTEESRVYAGLENVAISGRALVVAERQNEGIVVLGLEKGTVVTLYELNPKTFEKAGTVLSDVVEDDEGNFSFENVTLQSPYVLLTAERPHPERAYVFNAFVDVRDSSMVYMDMLMHLESLRALYLAKSGVPFVQAKKRGREEALAAFGIYGISDDVRENEIEYNALVYSLSRVLPSNLTSIHPISLPYGAPLLKKLFDGVAKKGSFWNLDASLNSSFADIVLSGVKELELYMGVPFEVYEKFGEDWIRDYQVKKLVLEYYAGMLSVVSDAGECDQEREGAIVAIPNPAGESDFKGDLNLACRSENWHVNIGGIEHVMGTMTDSRDGKTYKTVAINVNGSSQVWMAEDLKYDFGDGTLCDESVKLKDGLWDFVDGCYYSWPTLLHVDSSYLVRRSSFESVDDCKKFYVPDDDPDGVVDAYFDDYCKEELAERRFDWRRFGLKDCYVYYTWDGSDFVGDEPEDFECEITDSDVIDTVVYQGVCPDGWRLPRTEDWKNLLSFVEKSFGLQEGLGSLYLFDLAELGNPVGFGLRSRYMVMWLGDSADYIPPVSSGLLSVVGPEYAVAPGYVVTHTDKYGDPTNYGIANRVGIDPEGGMEFFATEDHLPVRCIKN